MTIKLSEHLGDMYHSKGINDLKLPMRIMKFVRDNIKIFQGGQGNITLHCEALWKMSEDEFERIFNVKLIQNDHKESKNECTATHCLLSPIEKSHFAPFHCFYCSGLCGKNSRF